MDGTGFSPIPMYYSNQRTKFGCYLPIPIITVFERVCSARILKFEEVQHGCQHYGQLLVSGQPVPDLCFTGHDARWTWWPPRSLSLSGLRKGNSMGMFALYFVLCFCAFWIGMGAEWIRERKYPGELKNYHKDVLKQHRRRMEHR